MVRILGYNFENTKNIYIALTTIYGIGLAKSLNILKKLNINANKKVKALSEAEIISLRNYFETVPYLIEGNLKRVIAQNIKRLIEINCYRGRRHLKGLPVRGQRTRTNNRSIRKAKNLIIKK